MNALSGPRGTINWQPVSDLVTSRPRATTSSYHLATESFSPRTRLQTGLSSRLIGCLPKAARCLWTASSRPASLPARKHTAVFHLLGNFLSPLAFSRLPIAASCEWTVLSRPAACFHLAANLLSLSLNLFSSSSPKSFKTLHPTRLLRVPLFLRALLFLCVTSQSRELLPPSPTFPFRDESRQKPHPAFPHRSDGAPRSCKSPPAWSVP